jgi:asparagine synthase (glutamine-hydrolysing)
MCGIFFSIGFETLPSQVIDSVAHRGPDGRGWNKFTSPQGPVVIAHRRLAIVDLSADGHQPMASEDGRYWVTYNGEIYNYIEIREELKAAGIHFRTQTDTEVLLKSYLHWGPDCLHKFNGMFAFVIWDDKEKKVFAARDRFGVKPLYSYQQGSKIAFASEIKQVTWLPGFVSLINLEHFTFLLENKFHPIGNTTLFRDVYHLEPGHWRTITGAHSQIERWYAPHANSSRPKSYHSEFLALFSDSVGKRLLADVPIGALLSGGLDSSSIVCILSRLIKENKKYSTAKTFTSWHEDPAVDEKQYSDAVIEKTKLENIIAKVKNDSLRKDIEDIVYHLEEPFFSTSIQSQWNIYKTISNTSDLKVVLDGQGSDELMCGYLFMIPEIIAQYMYQRHYLRALKEYIFSVRTHAPLSWKTLAIDVLSKTHPRIIEFIQKLRGKNVSIKPHQRFSSFLEYSTYMIRRSIEPQLRWQDRSSMAFGIESRHPFLDYRLIEFLLSLPQEEKYFNGTTKVILRKAMQGLLPDMVRNRVSKFGFPSPQKTLVESLDQEYFEKYFEIGRCFAQKVLPSLCAFEKLETNRFFLFSLGLWIHKFKVQI